MTDESLPHSRADSLLDSSSYDLERGESLHESACVAPEPDSWQIASTILQQSPRKLTLQAKITDWNLINIIIEPSQSDVLTFGDRLIGLIEKVQSGSKESALGTAVTEHANIIRSHCQQRWGTNGAPLFLHSIHVQSASGSSGIQLVERIDGELLGELQSLEKVLDTASSRHPPPCIPLDLLEPIVKTGSFFLPNTRLVRYQEKNYVAKGPIYPSRVSFDMAELVRVLNLPEPRSRHVLPKPPALITVSENDRRVGGFLMPYFANGNLDIYARKLRSQGGLTQKILLRWFRQIVDAMQYLSSHGSWHGDIKPDNILVDEQEDVALTDFTQAFSTCATASPEVRFPEPPKDPRSEKVTEIMGVPSSWELSSIMQSEVYSIGRTMYLICEGKSMMDIYQKIGWVNRSATFPTVFYPESKTPECLRRLILDCVQPDPGSRIDLNRLTVALDECIGQE